MPTRNFSKDKFEYWNELISHDTYSAYWKSRDPLPYLKNVRAAVMTVGGWFDAEDAYGALHTSAAVRGTESRRGQHSRRGPLVARPVESRRR